MLRIIVLALFLPFAIQAQNTWSFPIPHKTYSPPDSGGIHHMRNVPPVHSSVNRNQLKLDSLIYNIYWWGEWIPRTRINFEYNVWGQVRTELLERAGEEGWGKQSRYKYIYNSQGRLLNGQFQTYENEQWLNSYEWTYSYHSNGEITSYAERNWNGTEWTGEEGSKYTYEYNEIDSVSEFIRYTWGANDWVNHTKENYEYDQNGARTGSRKYSWSNGEWELELKRNRDYVSTTEVVRYDSVLNSASEWRPVNKYEKTLDGSGRLILQIRYGFYENQWEPDEKVIKSYDIRGNLNYVQKQDFFMSEWEKEEQWQAKYDPFGNQYEYINYDYWDSTDWLYGWKYERMFNEQIEEDEYLKPYWLEGSQVENVLSYEYIDGQWSIENNTEYYYSDYDVPEGVSELSDFIVSITPNPASDIINISFEEELPSVDVSLHYPNGGLAIRERCESPGTVDVSKLTPGVYIYQIQGEGVDTRGKIVIE